MEYLRCIHIDAEGNQCDNWYQSMPGSLIKLCTQHRDNVSVAVPIDMERADYLELVNRFRTKCAGMSLDQLDAHINHLHSQLEMLKHELYATRAIRSDELAKLSEEERQNRRKMKVAVTDDKKPNPPKKPTQSLELQRDIISVKNEGFTTEEAKMIANFMNKFKISREKAIAMIRE